MNVALGKTNTGFFKRFYNEKPVRTPGCDLALERIIQGLFRSFLLPKMPKILDLGCGDGRILRALRSRMPDSMLYGIDISEPNVQMLSTQGFDVSMADVSLEKLPYEDDFFDLCLMFDTIEHLYDPDHSLKEVKRVLRQSGTFLIKTPNLGFWINRLLLAVGIQPLHTEVSRERVLGRRFKFLGQGSQPVGHINIYTLPALLDILNLYGFRMTHVTGFRETRLRGLPGAVDQLLSRRASLSTSILVACSKEAQ